MTEPEPDKRPQMTKAKSTIGRRLIDNTTLWQDWGEENPEVAARYWELFTDLLLVAGASGLADNLMEHQNLLEFFVLYWIITNSWLLYTHHYTSRFQENSLAHSAVLFVFVSGMAISIVNISIESRAFLWAIALQRTAYLCMYVPIVREERSKAFGAVVISWVSASIIVLIVASIYISLCELLLASIVFIDLGGELCLMYLLKGKLLIPVNIEHSKDRLGVLVLVMLGETVISASIANREMGEDQQTEYYIVMMLSFLLIFLLCLTYFNVQPPPDHHAFRRSRFFSGLLYQANKLVGCTCLAVGVSIKLAIASMIDSKEELSKEEESEEEIDPAYTNELLALSVGMTMLLYLVMRICHYGGKYPKPSQPKPIYRLFMNWWYAFVLFCLLPFLFIHVKSTIKSLSIQCSLLFVWTIVETYFTHMLESELPSEEEEGEGKEEHYHLTEETNLLHK